MIGKLIDGLSKLQIIVGTVLLAVFFVVVSMQVFCRYMGIQAMWTEEVSQYAFIWAAFMGGSAMVNRKQHFAFSSLRDRVSGRRRYWYDLGISLIMLIFVAVMAVVGWQPVLRFWNHRWISIPALKMGAVWLCIPVTGITCSLYLLHHMLLDLLALGKEGSE